MDYEKQPIGEFLSAVASEQITPAGGSTAAVVGAAGAALCEMVCIHTIRNDEAGAADLGAVRSDLQQQRTALLALADEDAAAVDALLDATESSVDRQVKRTTGVPLAIAEGCLNVMESGPVVTEHGTPRAVPDAGTGVLLARGALQASLFTVRHNLDTIEDDSFVTEMRQRTADIESAADRALDTVASTVGTTYSY